MTSQRWQPCRLKTLNVRILGAAFGRRRHRQAAHRNGRHVLQALFPPQCPPSRHNPGNKTQQPARDRQRFVVRIRQARGSAYPQHDSQQRQAVRKRCRLQQVVRLEFEPYDIARFEMKISRHPRLEGAGSTLLQEACAASAAGSASRACKTRLHPHSGERAARCYDCAFGCI